MSEHGYFTRWIHLVIAALVATPIALTTIAAGAGVAHAADTVTAVDDAGPDDEPGQKDLSASSVNYGDPGATSIDVTWNWDDTTSSGANTRDGCSLFDTDGDGFANYSLCLTVDSSNAYTPSLYLCTADSRSDRCGSPTPVATINSTLTAAVGGNGSDPFGAGGSNPVGSHSSGNTCKDSPACYTQDTVATALVQLSDVGGGVAKLINVCSYPSQEPNSDPSDCVFQPNNGFLTIIKTVDDPTTDQFAFNATAASQNGQTQWSRIGGGSVATLISYAPTTTLDLNEVVPAAWNLSSKSCVIQTQTPTATGTGTATGVNDFEIRSGLETICTFGNTKKGVNLTVSKVWQNAKTGDAVSITTTGAANNVNFAPTANAANETDTAPAPYRVFAGETLTFAEAFTTGSPDAYNTTLACSGGVDTDPTNGLTIAPTDTAITCTYTNARRSAQVVVAKQLAPANDAGHFDLSINGATKVPNGGNGATSAANPVTVFVGDSVAVAEAASSGSPALANYTSALACDNGITLSPNTGTSGSFTVPSSVAGKTVICTFTNTRKSTTLTLQKAWAKPAAGDQVTLAIDGTNDDTSGPVVAPATTETASVTVYAGETVTISEAIAAGNTAMYDVDSITCSAGTVGWSGAETDTDATVAVSAANVASPITCTITNSAQRGTIVVVKNTQGGDGTFHFTGNWAGVSGFDLTTIGGTKTVTYNDVLVPRQGGYSVVESDPTPTFDGTNVTCSDNDGGSGPLTSAVKPLTGSIDLDDDETVTCTFTNTKRATIVIVKDAQPNSAQDFGFTTTGLATSAFTLDDDGNAANGTSNTFTSALVPAGGTYTVTEGSAIGWALNGASSSCTTGGSFNGSTATIVPAAGATVTCTFVNTANPAGLVATKHVANQVGPWGPFTFALSGGAFTGNAEQNVSSVGATASWTNLVEGQTYTVAESGPVPGYVLGTFTCVMSTGGAPTPLADADAQTAGFQFVGVAGAQYQCDITNTAISPTLVVKKTTIGGAGTFNFDITPVGANPASPPSLSATTAADNNQATTGTSTLKAGEGYSVSEQAQDAWIAGDITCTVVHAGGVSGAYPFNTPTLPGDVITCSITNTKRATITVWKQTTPDGAKQTFGFEGSWNGAFNDQADFTLSDGMSTSSGLINPGVPYSIKELGTSGWTLTGVTCRGNSASNPASVTPAPGENVVCVFSNSQLGDVLIDKVANPASIHRDGTTYTVTYKLTVTNLSYVDETYKLSDSPAFASGVTVQSMVVNGPGVTDLDIGPTGGTIVANGTIAARAGFDGNQPLVFTVVATFTMTGDTANRACSGAGSGTFNTATVEFARGVKSDSDCVPLPLPQISVEKVADQPVAELVDGNTYTASYTVTVTNDGDGPGQYDLNDLPAFGTGANVTDVTIDPAIVTDVNIDAHDSDVYSVTVTFTVDPAMPASERECAEQPTAGHGAYNGVTVQFNGGQDDGSACVDIPLPHITVTKVAKGEATLVGGNSYSAQFTVTVTNDGDGPGQYDVVDLPAFGAGATVTNVSPQFVNDVNIDAGETDVYTVTVQFTVDPAMPASERECGAEPTERQGGYNSVTVHFNDGGSDQDADCIDIPLPDIHVTKLATTNVATFVSGNDYKAVYTVTVENSGDGPGVYTLDDLPEFGTGANVTDVSFDPMPAEPVAINAGDDDVYTVTVLFTVDPAMPASERDCATQPTAGQGAYNGVTVHFNDDGSDHSADCIDIPKPGISVSKSANSATAELVSGNTYEAEYTVTVINTGTGPGSYTLADVPDLGDGANVVGDPVFVPAISGAVGIEAGGTDTYTVTVTFTVDPAMPASERDCATEPTAGKGAYNLATVTFEGGTDDDSACVDIPLPDISVTKVATTDVATKVSGNTYKAVYTVTVTNDGDGPGSYSLTDLPEFGSGANVVGQPVFDPAIVGSVGLNAGDNDVYTVTVNFTVDGSMPDSERECFTQPTPGSGAYNGVTVNFNDGGTDHSADCIDIPEPDISRDKIVDPQHPLTRNADGTWTVGYVLTVSNASDAGPATYDIDDELSFGPGVDVTHIAVSENIASVTVDPNFTGEGLHTNIASDVLINGGETHEYHVLLTLEITVVPGINGDCDSEGGINNSLIVSVRGGEGQPVSVCDDFSTLTLIKQLDSGDGGNAVIGDFVLSASAGEAVVFSGTSGIASAVPADTYGLSETQLAGYTSDGFVCDNDESQEPGDTAGVGIGENVTCTIRNDDLPVDLELTKDDAGFVATAGQLTPFPYTISVTNVGERDLDDEPVTVVDDLPAAFAWVAPAPAGCDIDGQVLTCDVDPAALAQPGDEITITAMARLTIGGQAGTYDNRAYVTTHDDAVCVPEGEAQTCTPPPCSDTEGIAANNNVDCEPTPVNPALRVTAFVPQCVSDAPFIFYNIEPLGFTPVTTPTIKLFDKLGHLVATHNVSTLSGRVIYPGAQVDNDGTAIDWPGWKFENGLWSIDASDSFLRDGLHAVIELNATAEVDVIYPAATEGCANPQQVSADMAIVKNASQSQVGAGGTFNWVLDVTNNGPDVATAVKVGDIVPSQLVVNGVTSGQFACTNSGNSVSCTKPTMAVGEKGQITIAVSVPLTAASGTVTNVGTVEAVTPDPNLSNNSDDASVDVVAQAPPPPTVPPVILPPTGSNSTTPVTWAAISLVLMGGAVLLVSRRRRDHSSID